MNTKNSKVRPAAVNHSTHAPTQPALEQGRADVGRKGENVYRTRRVRRSVDEITRLLNGIDDALRGLRHTK
jgi:hypothetical protein